MKILICLKKRMKSKSSSKNDELAMKNVKSYLAIKINYKLGITIYFLTADGIIARIKKGINQYISFFKLIRN